MRGEYRMMKRATDKSELVHPLSADMVDFFLQELNECLKFSDEKVAKWAENYRFGHMQHYRDVLDIVGKIVRTDYIKYVLDIGAVPGHITMMLKYAGLNVSAVDIAPNRACQSFDDMGISSYKVDLDRDDLPFEDNCYDLVLFCEVLEHLRVQPLYALYQIHRIARYGGHLLLSIPNITPLMRWRFLFGQDFQGNIIEEFNKIDTIGHMGHFRLYSEKEIKQILCNVGFDVVCVNRGGKVVPDKSWDARILRMLVPHLMKNQLYIWARKH